MLLKGEMQEKLFDKSAEKPELPKNKSIYGQYNEIGRCNGKEINYYPDPNRSGFGYSQKHIERRFDKKG